MTHGPVNANKMSHVYTNLGELERAILRLLRSLKVRLVPLTELMVASMLIMRLITGCVTGSRELAL